MAEASRSADMLSLDDTSTSAPKAQGVLLDNSSTAELEVQRRVELAPTGGQTIPWADISISLTPNYKETLVWLDAEVA